MYMLDVQPPEPATFVEVECQLGNRSGSEASSSQGEE